MKNYVSELICTRISHDIIGNIGAVANASELLEEGDMDFLDDIKNILKTSSFNLTARMKFFRMAFGVDNNNLANMDLVKKTSEDYLHSLGSAEYPIELKWNINNPDKSKDAMIMLMIMADLLIRGGKIEIHENNNQIIATISAESRTSTDKWQRFEGLLQGNSDYVDANSAPLVLLTEKYGNTRIGLTNDDNEYRLTLLRD